MAEDALRDGIDKLATDILAKVTVGDAIEQSVLKAMDVVTVLGKWYGIRNKVIAGGDDPDEGAGIDGYKAALSAENPVGERADNRPSGIGGGDGRASADPLVAGNPAEPLRIGPSREPRKQGRSSDGGAFSGDSTDRDAGGADLDRIMASLPGHAGRVARDKHAGGDKNPAVAGGDRSGVSGVAGDAESDLDELIGNSRV